MTTDLFGLAEITDTAKTIVERIVWCSVTTVGPDGAPRSRLMHPVWSWTGAAPVGLVTARPTALKVRHLETNPEVTCFYWDPAHDTVAIDASAEWLDTNDRIRAWAEIKSVPTPVGFDPSMIWPDGPTARDCGILRLTAHRIVATQAGGPGLRWVRTPVKGHR
jgi:hypothetical protein